MAFAGKYNAAKLEPSGQHLHHIHEVPKIMLQNFIQIYDGKKCFIKLSLADPEASEPRTARSGTPLLSGPASWPSSSSSSDRPPPSSDGQCQVGQGVLRCPPRPRCPT